MIVKVLKQHTSVGNKVAIQQKSRWLPSGRLHWWYLVRSDESIPETFDSEWEQVKSATDSARWKLEYCQRPNRLNPATEHQEGSPEQSSDLQPGNGEETQASTISNETVCPGGDPPAVDQVEAPFLEAPN